MLFVSSLREAPPAHFTRVPYNWVSQLSVPRFGEREGEQTVFFSSTTALHSDFSVSLAQSLALSVTAPRQCLHISFQLVLSLLSFSWFRVAQWLSKWQDILICNYIKLEAVRHSEMSVMQSWCPLFPRPICTVRCPGVPYVPFAHLYSEMSWCPLCPLVCHAVRLKICQLQIGKS